MEDFILTANTQQQQNRLKRFKFTDFVIQTHHIDVNNTVSVLRSDTTPQDTINNPQGQQLGACKYFQKGTCFRGAACPFRHGKPEKSIVCKHWLRGLCKKGEHCEFLHEYNLKKMPECWFFSKYGECSNPDCFYLHVDPNQRQKECLWYARGFCKHGPNCRSRHVRSVLCPYYLCGFCPYGPQCEYGHPKYELPIVNPGLNVNGNLNANVNSKEQD